MPTLDWIGKKAVVNHHNEVPFHLLKEVSELSVGEFSSGNLLLEGDNLIALKALLPYYAGQVKCIYIDPPYNTGNEGWVYNDNVNSPVIREWLGKVVGKEAEDLSRHDKWLCMMYPRLCLLRELLREDGVILISMGRDEIATVKMLCDEVFGGQNVIEILVWNTHGHTENQEEVTGVHEYVVLYAKTSVRHEFAMWWTPRFPLAQRSAEILLRILLRRTAQRTRLASLNCRQASQARRKVWTCHPCKISRHSNKTWTRWATSRAR